MCHAHPMTADPRHDLPHRQFDLTWALFEYHLVPTIDWPGPGKPTVDRPRAPRTTWLTATAPFPWPNDLPYAVADLRGALGER